MNDDVIIDHVVSRNALELYIAKYLPDRDTQKLRAYIQNAPAIAIPVSVHTKFTATYEGRISASKQIEDAKDLKSALERGMDALKPGLLEYGLVDAEIEAARQQLHDLYEKQGWYA